jgi:hypothetical protein
MIRSPEIFPRSLRHALLANRVVGVLAQLKKNQLPPDRTTTLNEAIVFLNDTLEGRELSKSLMVSERAIQQAAAYGEAIRAISLSFNAPADADVEQELRKLTSVANHLLHNENVEVNEITRLESFFSNVRTLSLTQRNGVPEKVRYGV